MSKVTANSQPSEQLQLGLFMPNCSNSVSISTYKAVPDDWTYDSNKAIARKLGMTETTVLIAR